MTSSTSQTLRKIYLSISLPKHNKPWNSNLKESTPPYPTLSGESSSPKFQPWLSIRYSSTKIPQPSLISCWSIESAFYPCKSTLNISSSANKTKASQRPIAWNFSWRLFAGVKNSTKTFQTISYKPRAWSHKTILKTQIFIQGTSSSSHKIIMKLKMFKSFIQIYWSLNWEKINKLTWKSMLKKVSEKNMPSGRQSPLVFIDLCQTSKSMKNSIIKKMQNFWSTVVQLKFLKLKKVKPSSPNQETAQLADSV